LVENGPLCFTSLLSVTTGGSAHLDCRISLLLRRVSSSWITGSFLLHFSLDLSVSVSFRKRRKRKGDREKEGNSSLSVSALFSRLHLPSINLSCSVLEEKKEEQKRRRRKK
jgi:hypothetical protein